MKYEPAGLLSVACLGVGLLATAACSNDFACEETRSCPSDVAGSSGNEAGGVSGSGGVSGTAGGSDAPAPTGGAAGAGAPDSGAESGPPDLTPPTIVSIFPDDGAVGMAKDAVLVITFSEAMNRLAAESAYQSTDLPAAQAVLTWSTDGKVLTVTPNAELEYAIGTTPAAPAKKYTVNVTSAAQDLAGIALAPEFTASFTTLRRITQQIASGDGVSTTSSGMGFYRCSAEGHLVAGEDGNNIEYRGWLVFSITPLPTGITSFESATLTVTQISIFGKPYGPASDNLGDLLLEHTHFAVMDETVHSAAPLRELGEFSTSAALEAKSASVLDAIKDDYANRGPRNNRSQYRLRFTRATDDDGMPDTATFSCGIDAPKPTLSVTYLIP